MADPCNSLFRLRCTDRFGTGNATQVNTITTAIDTALINFNIIPESASKTLNLVLGIVIMLLVGMVLLGGIKRIGSVSENWFRLWHCCTSFLRSVWLY